MESDVDTGISALTTDLSKVTPSATDATHRINATTTTHDDDDANTLRKKTRIVSCPLRIEGGVI